MVVIIACFKWVIDEAYIRHNASGQLDLTSVDYKISNFDRNAIEEAVRLKETHQGKVIALTLGVPEDAKGVRDALSRGPDEAYFIADPSFANQDAHQTASILAEVIRTRIVTYNLILCGEGSSDFYNQQVGPRLAEALNIPCISFAQRLAIEGDQLEADRRVEEGIETLRTNLPAVATVLPEINVPRIPSVKNALMASKKPVITIKKEEIPYAPKAQLQTVDLTASNLERHCQKFQTEPADITRFVDAIGKKALLK